MCFTKKVTNLLTHIPIRRFSFFQALSSVASHNLTSLRVQAASPITKRDLNSFVDQLHTVGRQLSDAATARKFDNIAFSMRKVILNELQKLTELKNGILLKITMLEVLLPPLVAQANRSLQHLQHIQYFLDNERRKVAEKVIINNYLYAILYLKILFLNKNAEYPCL